MGGLFSMYRNDHVGGRKFQYPFHQNGFSGRNCNARSNGQAICGIEWNLLRSGILEAERKEMFRHGR
jgi:hypothetical protein